ncbi:MAG: Heterodisulfide reductase subunit A-like protein [Methanosaeta sp. PtaB.Bin039]|nr:MAG: Heterodisulfide reductase subunit A-like protein [Methanosaeta sp. PtaB.Bin039]HOT05963.1 4Fe-4S dicluster domain-containing protein [Methanotrichaceae archaeon]HQF16833.1 4Fe-4S dicluster domain-containing protein [Methanotrichaceae archaeon]HQI90159.1 4Fe-4S dicluster domain-containing protein [Methanotrichaceae archaeon]HQJ29119.1 4Fe-4S dicluster domain-containing protein [Methanotrichaceae archaeon]
MTLRRQVELEGGRCIGCTACSSSCPAGLIDLSQHNGLRRIRFSACDQDCQICQEACPTQAIRLVPGEASVEVSFPLLACRSCGQPDQPAALLEHLRICLQDILPADSWLDICPSCRRKAEGRNLAGQWLKARE